VYATARSFVAGGPEPQEGGGLGQAQTVMVLRSLQHQSPDQASACVEGTVATKEQFCFILLHCIILAIATRQDKNAICRVFATILSSINLQHEAN